MSGINFENLYFKAVKRYCKTATCPLKKLLQNVNTKNLSPLVKDEVAISKNSAKALSGQEKTIENIIETDLSDFTKIIGERVEKNKIVQKNSVGKIEKEFYSEDGKVLNSITEYDTKTGKISKETMFYNNGKTVHEQREYDIDTGKLIRKEQYNGEEVHIYDKITGKEIQYQKFEKGRLYRISYYDSVSGKAVKAERYDENGNVLEILEWSPNTDKLTRFDQFYTSGKLRYTKSLDSEGKTVKEVSFYENGIISRNSEYNPKTGKCIRVEDFYEDGNTLKKTEIYSPKTGYISSETAYRNDGSKEYTCIYDEYRWHINEIQRFDKNNKLVETKLIDEDFGFSHLSDAEFKVYAEDFVKNIESKSIDEMRNIRSELDKRYKSIESPEKRELYNDVRYEAQYMMKKKSNTAFEKIADYTKEIKKEDNVRFDHYMSQDECSVLFDYYDQFPHNTNLRLGKLSDKAMKEIKIMDQGLEKCPPLSAETIVYRGVCGCENYHPNYQYICDFIENIKPGAIITDKAYVSVTPNTYCGCFRQFGHQAVSSNGYIFKIKLPKGTKIAMNGDEGVLPRNSQFKVIKVYEVDGVKVADLEYLLP